MDATKGTPTADPERPRPSGSFGSKISSRSSEHSIAKLMETLEATTGKGTAAGPAGTEEESKEESKGGESSSNAVDKLSETCASLQLQVEQLQNSLTGVVKFMSSFSLDSSYGGRRDSDSTSTCTQDTASFHYFGGGAGRVEDPGRPMFASLDPSTFVLANQNEQQQQPPSYQSQQQQQQQPGTMSKSCDSLVQTDISAVLTPKAEDGASAQQHHPFFHLKTVDIPIGEVATTSDSELVSSAEVKSKSSPRPSTLPGLNEEAALKKKGVPGLKALAGKAILESPVAPPEVKSFARNMVEGLLTDVSKEQQQQQADETDVSLSLLQDEEQQQQLLQQQEEVSQSSHVETDSLDERSPKKTSISRR